MMKVPCSQTELKKIGQISMVSSKATMWREAQPDSSTLGAGVSCPSEGDG